MSEDFWGDIDDDSPPDSPKRILQEQAELLVKKTDGRLEATVASQGGEKRIRTTLAVVAPTLNYRFDLVTVFYDLEFYPLVMSDEIANKRHRCASVSEFRERLRTTLSSQRTKKRLQRLLDATSQRVKSVR